MSFTGHHVLSELVPETLDSFVKLSAILQWAQNCMYFAESADPSGSSLLKVSIGI